MTKIIKYFILLILSLFLLISCGQTDDDSEIDGVSKATSRRYRENEITEYEGARLEPVIGPRDNSIKGVQQVSLTDYSLKVTGLVKVEKDLDYDTVLDLDSHIRKITLYCVEGWDATILWEGVLLKDIMDIATIKPEANTVIFHSIDGYNTSLPLDTIINKELILAYSANGLKLPAEMGFPFIVVAEDKLGYKWARWVTEIELSDDVDFRGYWEKAGYDNEAGV